MPSQSQAQILAQAIYEIRQLLSGYLGSEATAEMAVREAAHLAYALHNEALAILDGKTFDVKNAISKIGAVDAMFNESFASRFEGLIHNETA
jgi:hypothetical protein